MGKYSVIKSRQGAPSMILEENGRTIRLHSAFDPAGEAAKAADLFSRGRASVILVSGLGLGYHAAALKKKFPDAEILVLEKNREVYDLAVLHCPENLSGITVLLSDEDIMTFFENFDITMFRGITSFEHRPSVQTDPVFYREKSGLIKEQISSRVSDMLTRFEFQERWTDNIFANLPAYSRAFPVSRLFGKFRGIPGIIVSAGPSLRKNVRLLKDLEKKAVILCVDTSYKVCLKCGIQPHIVMTLDAQKHSVKHFLGTGGKTLLVADMVSSPAILRDAALPCAVSSTAKYFTDSKGRSRRETTPVMDWLEARMEPSGDIQSGGSVATSAFDLLLNMGCDPVILTGQDLAYTGREIHCAGTHHNDDWLPSCTRLKNLDTINQAVIRKRKMKQVKAWGGSGTVLTDFVLDLYRMWFQDAADTAPFTTINATEGGARIHGVRESTLADLCPELPEIKKTPGSILEDLLSAGSHADMKKLSSDLNQAAAALEHLLKNRPEGPAALRLRKAEDFLEKEGIRSLTDSFLRKTLFFAERRNQDPEKASEIILADLYRAAGHLIPLLKKSSSAIKSGKNNC